MSAVQVRVSEAAALVLMTAGLVVGCTAPNAAPGTPGGKATRASIAYANLDDDYPCKTGYPIFSFHHDWYVDGNDRLSHLGDRTSIQAFCNHQEKYTGDIPAWTLEDMIKMVYAPELKVKPDVMQRRLTIDGVPAIELEYKANGHWWTELSLIKGDEYIAVQADTVGGQVSPEFQKEINAVLTSVTFVY